MSVVLSGALSASSAHALDYEYQAPNGCPDQQAFVDAVEQRLKYPAEQSSVERIAVTVVKTSDFAARFELTEPQQMPVRRTVRAARCEQAVEALALAAALALDARYREVRGIAEPVAPVTSDSESQAPGTTPPDETEPEPEPDTTTPTPSSTTASAPARPARSQNQAAPATPASAKSKAAEPSNPSSPPSPPFPALGPLRFRTQLAAFGATGYAPRASFGPSIGVAVQGTLLELGVEAFYGVESRARSAGQRAEFWVIGGRLSPCLRTDVTDRFSLKGCGALEFSGVRAEGVEGTGVLRVEKDLVPFWALGLATGLGVALTPSLSLTAELGAQFPLVRRSFYFSNPYTKLHEFPAVAARGSLGVCYAF